MIRRLLGAASLSVTLLGTALLPASAQEGVVMTTYGGGTGQTWREVFAKPFQAETGIPATVVDTLNPEAQLRAQVGGAQQYNIALLLFPDAIKLHNDGLLETFDPADIPEMKDVPEAKGLTDASGKFFGIPIYFTYYGIALNTDMAKPSDFASWQALADPKWKGKLAVTRPIIAAGYDLTAMAYATGGDAADIDKGVELFRKLVANSQLTYNSPAHLNQLISQGEITAAPFYHSGIWRLQLGGASNLTIVLPKEGGLMLPYAAVVPKGAKGLDAVKKFLRFSSRDTVQAKAIDASGYMPMNPAVTFTKEQEKLVGMPLTELRSRIHNPDWAVVAAKRDERVKLVEKIQAGQ